MGSGKTARLIELAEQVPAENRLLLTTHSPKFITSRNSKSLITDAILAGRYPIVHHAKDKTHVFIDEGQWISDNLELMIEILNHQRHAIKIYIAMLDRDYTGKHYNIFNMLKKVADKIEHLRGICAVTGGYASYSELLADHESTRKEDYRAVCWDVFKQSKHCRI
jgi:thymidine kinase